MNMNEKPTGQELLNAGAKHSPIGTLYVLTGKNGFQFYLNPKLNSFILYDFDHDELSRGEFPTKAELSFMWKFFTGKELDWGNDYSYDDCFDAFEGGICTISGTIPITKAPKYIALAKLEFIIAAIDRDYPSRNGGFIAFRGTSSGNLCYGGEFIGDRNEYLITTASEQGAKILIKHHHKLLEKAFEIE